MTKIPKDIQRFIRETPLAYVATVSEDGVPNIAPKGSLRIIDDETLLFAELFPGKTSRNLKANRRVAIAFVKPDRFEGYQIKGEAEVVTEGEVYERTVEAILKLLMDLPKPRAAAVIKVKEIYLLSPGPDAGRKIEG